MIFRGTVGRKNIFKTGRVLGKAPPLSTDEMVKVLVSAKAVPRFA